MRARSAKTLLLVFLGLLGGLPAAGCGDGDSTRPPEQGSAGDGTTDGDSGAGGASGAGGSESGAGGDGATAAGGDSGAGAGESGASGTGGGSAGAPSGCGATSVEALSPGVWDRRFTISGLTGHDGITPNVYDFAVDSDGSVLATGRFAYHEDRAVTPLVRFRDGEWSPVHETWSIEPPGDGFSALALGDGGVLALATGDSFGERHGEVWLDEAGEQTVIASFAGQVRSLAWFEGKLYVAGAFELSRGSDIRSEERRVRERV